VAMIEAVVFGKAAEIAVAHLIRAATVMTSAAAVDIAAATCTYVADSAVPAARVSVAAVA